MVAAVVGVVVVGGVFVVIRFNVFKIRVIVVVVVG